MMSRAIGNQRYSPATSAWLVQQSPPTAGPFELRPQLGQTPLDLPAAALGAMAVANQRAPLILRSQALASSGD